MPKIGEFEQAAGAEYRARALRQEMNADRVVFALDLTACYPAEAGVRRLARTFELGGGRLTVTDEYDLTEARPFETASSVEKRSNTRTGSSDDSTVTAEPSQMRLVRAAIAASTTSGSEMAKSGR